MIVINVNVKGVSPNVKFVYDTFVNNAGDKHLIWVTFRILLSLKRLSSITQHPIECPMRVMLRSLYFLHISMQILLHSFKYTLYVLFVSTLDQKSYNSLLMGSNM